MIKIKLTFLIIITALISSCSNKEDVVMETIYEELDYTHSISLSRYADYYIFKFTNLHKTLSELNVPFSTYLYIEDCDSIESKNFRIMGELYISSSNPDTISISANTIYHASYESLRKYYRFSLRDYNGTTISQSKIYKHNNIDLLSEEIRTLQPIDMGLSVKWADWNLAGIDKYKEGIETIWGWSTDSEDTPPACISGTDYDIAKISLGGNWRMPTFGEYLELKSQCELQADTINGIAGYTAKAINGNEIFFPNGWYWTGTAYSENEAWAFGSGGAVGHDHIYRPYISLYIRPVCD